MGNTKFIYLVIDREYLRASYSSVRSLRFARKYEDVLSALNYIKNLNKEDLLIITMLESEYLELKERIERLCT